jgi:hypothetical protein
LAESLGSTPTTDALDDRAVHFAPDFLIELSPDWLVTKNANHPLEQGDLQQNSRFLRSVTHSELVEGGWRGSLDFPFHFAMRFLRGCPPT